jgi:hypothetical protein
MTADQEDIQFQMESKTSMSGSNAIHINLAELWHKTLVYPKLMD